MDDANDVVTSNLQLKLRPFSTESSKSDYIVLQALDGARWPARDAVLTST